MTPPIRSAAESLPRQGLPSLIVNLSLRVTGKVTTTGRPRASPNPKLSLSFLKALGNLAETYQRLSEVVGSLQTQANQYATTTIWGAAMMRPQDILVGVVSIFAALQNARTAETMSSRTTEQIRTSESVTCKVALPRVKPPHVHYVVRLWMLLRVLAALCLS